MDVRKRLGFFRMLGVWGEVRTLEQHLEPGEVVEAVGVGKAGDKGGLLAATSKRVLWVAKDGLVPTVLELPYGDIKAFTSASGLLDGTLEFGLTSLRFKVAGLDLKMFRELKYAIEKGRAA